MAKMIGITLRGADEMIARLGPELIAGPARNMLTRMAVRTQAYARVNAPKDSGRLANSIAFLVDSAVWPAWAKVGTNVGYAKPMEYGTGALSDAPESLGWHFPSGSDLDRWASRHGFSSGYVVAAIIKNRGGLRPRKYLRKAFKQIRGNIPGFLRVMAQEVEALWAR